MPQDTEISNILWLSVEDAMNKITFEQEKKVLIDIINKKRLGKILSDEEIKYVIDNYLNGNIKDYQVSSLLMAIYLNGMTDEEALNCPFRKSEVNGK